MMKMTEAFRDDPWEGIDAGTYPAGRRMYAHDDRFWASKNKAGQHVFFVQDECTEEPLQLKDLNGVEFFSEKVTQNEFRIICTLTSDELDLKANFAVVCKQISAACTDVSGRLLFKKLNHHIGIWAKFLKPNPKGLSKSEHIGLWGELFSICNILAPLIGTEKAVQAWIGPDGKKHDLLYTDKAVEVKTTMAGDPRTISISSLDQLDAPDYELFLLHLHALPSADLSAESLLSLRKKIVTELQSNPALEAKFCLDSNPFFAQATKEQMETAFKLIKPTLFHVTNGFPKITRLAIPNGIAAANYKIYLAALQGFDVTETMAEVLTDE